MSPHYPEGSCLIFLNSGHARKPLSSTGTAGGGALGGAPGFSHPRALARRHFLCFHSHVPRYPRDRFRDLATQLRGSSVWAPCGGAGVQSSRRQYGIRCLSLAFAVSKEPAQFRAQPPLFGHASGGGGQTECSLVTGDCFNSGKRIF